MKTSTEHKTETKIYQELNWNQAQTQTIPPGRESNGENRAYSPELNGGDI